MDPFKRLDNEIEALTDHLRNARLRAGTIDGAPDAYIKNIEEHLNALIMKKREIMYPSGPLLAEHQRAHIGVFTEWTKQKTRMLEARELERKGYSQDEIDEMFAAEDEGFTKDPEEEEIDPGSPIVSGFKKDRSLRFPGVNIEWRQELRIDPATVQSAGMRINMPCGPVEVYYSRDMDEIRATEPIAIFGMDRGDGRWWSEALHLRIGRAGIQDALMDDVMDIYRKTANAVEAVILQPFLANRLHQELSRKPRIEPRDFVRGDEIYLAGDRGQAVKLTNIEPPDTRTPFQKELDNIK